MEAIERAAFTSIGRACGFAGLAVITLMLGLSFEPVLALRIGGYGGFGVTAILLLYAFTARIRPYKRTETWLLIPKDQRPPADIAQRVIGNHLREAYFWFAQQACLLSAAMLGASLILRFLN